MDNLVILEDNLDYFSMTVIFTRKTNQSFEKKIKEEILSHIVKATTLNHNRWEKIKGKSSMLRSQSGLTLLAYTNRIILQASGEAFIYLDEFDIKNIFVRMIGAIKEAIKNDIEDILEVEPTFTVGRLDSQFLVAIKEDYIEEVFKKFNLKEKRGDLRFYVQNYQDKQFITGATWIKKPTKNYYQMSPDELLKTPQIEADKVDFLRIYDKLIEVIETNPPFSEKRNQFINEHKDLIKRGYRIFRVEVEERENRLTKHLQELLNEETATFKTIAKTRMEKFKKRNPFIIWNKFECQGNKP